MLAVHLTLGNKLLLLSKSSYKTLQMSTGKEISDKVESLKSQSNPGERPLGHPDDSWGGRFRGDYLERDEYDTVYQVKQLISQNPNRIWDVTDKEANYLLDKTKQYELMSFHEMLARHYHIDASNPVLMKWAQDMFPEYWEMREKKIDQNADIQKRLAKIKLLGPRSKDDFTLLFAIATGRFQVPRGPIYAPGLPVPHVARGLFNPIRGIGKRAGFVDANGIALPADVTRRIQTADAVMNAGINRNYALLDVPNTNIVANGAPGARVLNPWLQ